MPPATKPERDLQVDCLRIGVLVALAMTAVQRIIGLARGVVFCRLMPEDELGQWSLAMSYLMLLAPLAVLGLPGSFGRYVEHFRLRGQLKIFLGRVAIASIILTAALTALMWNFAESISRWMFRESGQGELIGSMAFVLLPVAGHNFLVSLMESLRQVRLATVMRFLAGVSFAVIGVSVVFVPSTPCWSSPAQAIVIAFGLSCFLGSLPAIWYLKTNWEIIDRSDGALSHRSMWARIAPFAAWLWVVNLLWNFYDLADRNMLLHLAATSSQQAQALVGQYHSGRVIPLLLVGIAVMLGGIMMPYLTAHWETGNRQRASSQLRWTLKLAALGATAIGLVALVLSPILFQTILLGKYNAGLAVLPMTLVYCIWIGLLTLGQDSLWCMEKGKWACAAVGLGLLANVALNMALIPRFGLQGAVWSTTISNLMALVSLYLINNYFGWRMDRGTWFAACVPLVLLMPVGTGLAVFLIICWAGLKYQWVFSSKEVAELRGIAGSVVDKMGMQRRWTATS